MFSYQRGVETSNNDQHIINFYLTIPFLIKHADHKDRA